MANRNQVLAQFRDNSDYINTRVEADIQRHRKGWAQLEIVDGAGNPVPNAAVEVNLSKHDFQFGCNLFLLDEIEDPVKNQTYKDRYVQCFNQATLPFYWDGLEPEEGQLRFTKDSPPLYRRPTPDLCVEWCKENGIAPKVHCLNYHNESPKWVSKESTQYWKTLERRYSQLAERYADQIHSWEVTNETIRFHSHKDFSRGTTPFYDKDFVERSFYLAEKYFPHNELIINEAHFAVWGENFKEDRSNYYMQIERALLKGARIDTIGLQFHMFFPKESELEDTKAYYDPYVIFGLMDRYADFGKPLQITEITVPAYSESPEDESIQAELATWLYKMWFSHPNMETITYWNLIDGYAWSEDNIPGNMSSGENAYYGGLLRFDGTPKPIYHALYDLIHKQWHTQEQMSTDQTGHCNFHGFYGTYDVTVHNGDKTSTHSVHLTKSRQAPLRIVLD